jgi:hypothetical protein
VLASSTRRRGFVTPTRKSETQITAKSPNPLLAAEISPTDRFKPAA